MSASRSASAAPALRPRPKRRKWLWTLIASIIVILVLFCGLMAVPVVSPAAGAAMADGLRSIIGPEAVAEIESFQFGIQDAFNRARYQVSGGQSQISWAESGTDTSAPPLSIAVKPVAKENSAVVPALNRAAVPSSNQTVKPSVDVVTAPSSARGWQAFGALINDAPVMARTVVKPDPTRPYAQAAIVRIDLQQVQLHAVPGTIEPVAAKGTPPLKRPGKIATADQSADSLLAAFNGGFKAIHGGYGMMVNGVTLLPPTDNLATLALYKDGSVRIGAWRRDLSASNDMVAFRQNCPLLIDQGAINPHVNDENRKEWGYTVKNLDTTWRSGIGLTQDGRFLIYAVGNSLTVQSLAEALRQAGAYYAMQLDINGFYTRFVTYKPAANSQVTGYPVIANKLLNEMSGDPALFLHPYDRDFFYLTVKS